ncbi:FkbM family methyltransferase [Vibrio sp. TRT 2004]|uniref:FkbM family methyltransferase n=1 Tax=Vibrio sp. TRT 2004 TaxID=3418506 RepID=UPI003CF10EF9
MEHLRVWGGFKENDISGKSSKEDFLRVYHEIIEQFLLDKFSWDKSILPIDASNAIIDGAHRASVCVALEKRAHVVNFNNKFNIYNYDFFIRKGLGLMYCDETILDFCRTNNNVYLVFLFPIAIDRKNEVEKVLTEQCEVFYSKSIEFTNRGALNLTSQLYKNEQWLGEREKGWPGAAYHVSERFRGSDPLTVYVVTSDSLDSVKKIKNDIRALYELGNFPVHINDTHEETVRLAEQLFNKNSLDFINNANLNINKRVHNLHHSFKEELSILSIDKELYCIDSSAVLALYGLRDCRDFDFLTVGEDIHQFSNKLIGCHNLMSRYYKNSISEMIYNPTMHFYYDGVKYLSLDLVYDMKLIRGESKDLQDISLINDFRSGISTLSNNIVEPKENKIYRMILNMVPKKIKRKVKSAILLTMKIVNEAKVAIQKKIGIELNCRYLRYDLVYSPGTSLVGRLTGGSVYEPDVTAAIVREIVEIENPVIFDIGSNIGLISLNILNFNPNAKIFAFEPGLHQRSLFEKTILKNELLSNIELSSIALSDNKGVHDFVIHDSQHASGDGFFDTGRAGKGKVITVETDTLDNFSSSRDLKSLDLIKIDTEGAELAILKGARDTMCTHRPKVIFEMHKDNLLSAMVNPTEILDYFSNIDYEVYTLTRQRVDESNLSTLMETNFDYLAVPK